MMSHTRKQGELLAFITKFIAEKGIGPSSDEMKDAMGLASKSGINRMLNGLEERGLIRRVHFRARAIEVVDQPGLNLSDLERRSDDDLLTLRKRIDLVLASRQVLAA